MRKKISGARVVLWGIAAGFSGMIVGMYVWDCLVDGWEFHAGALVILVIPWLLSVWRFIVLCRRYQAPARKAAPVEARRIREELERRDRTPVAAVLISTRDVTGKRIGSTAARAAVGYVLFGSFGAGVGMMTAKRKRKREATFSVEYESGRTAVKTVDVGSSEFKEYAKLLVE